MSRSLSVYSDDRGAVTVGFLAADVYYFRIDGYLSARIGAQCAAQLGQHFAEAKALTCFVDVGSSQGSDFAARGGVMRVLLANQKRLSSITTLVPAGPGGARARALVTLLGRAGQVIESPALFQTQLLEAAPHARNKIPPTSGTFRVQRSVRPAKSLRPRARSAGGS